MSNNVLPIVQLSICLARVGDIGKCHSLGTHFGANQNFLFTVQAPNIVILVGGYNSLGEELVLEVGI